MKLPTSLLLSWSKQQIGTIGTSINVLNLSNLKMYDYFENVCATFEMSSSTMRAGARRKSGVCVRYMRGSIFSS